MSQNWGKGIIPCIVFCCVALCFNDGWILALFILFVFFYEGIKGETKNQQEKEYIRLFENEMENIAKYQLKEHEKQLKIISLSIELNDTTPYTADICQIMAKSIVYRYNAEYLVPYCISLQSKAPNAPVKEIQEMAQELVKQKYLQEVEENQKIMFSPSTPFPSGYQLKYKK